MCISFFSKDPVCLTIERELQRLNMGRSLTGKSNSELGRLHGDGKERSHLKVFEEIILKKISDQLCSGWVWRKCQVLPLFPALFS